MLSLKIQCQHQFKILYLKEFEALRNFKKNIYSINSTYLPFSQTMSVYYTHWHAEKITLNII